MLKKLLTKKEAVICIIGLCIGFHRGMIVGGNIICTRLLKHRKKSRDEEDYHIVFGNREDAEEVVGKLNNIWEVNGIFTLADFKNMSGIMPSYRDTQVVWEEYDMKVLKCLSGYYISLSEPTRGKR